MQQRNRRRGIRLIISVGAAAAPLAHAATVPWTNLSGGNFSDLANWNNGVGPIPGAIDTALFSTPGAYNIVLTGSLANNGVTAAGGNATLLTDGTPRTYTVSSAAFNTGTLTLGPSPAALSMNAQSLSVTGGGGLYINNGNHVTVGNAPQIGMTTSAGLGAVATLSVDGAGSSFAVTSGITNLASGNAVANVSFAHDAVGTFRDLFTASTSSQFVDANLTVASGADVSVTGYFQWGTSGTHANQSYVMNVTGAGSTVTHTNGFFIIGQFAGASTSTLNITDGAVFNTNHAGGGYTMQVNPNATVDFTGGTLNASSGINLPGGTLRRSNTTGTLNWPEQFGRTLSITAGGKFDYAGAFDVSPTTSYATNITLSNTNSKMLIGGQLTVGRGTTINVNAGTTLSAGSLLLNGPSGIGGIIIVDGAGATLTTGAAVIGGSSSQTGSLTIRNGATATFSGQITHDPGTQGKFTIETGAQVTATDILVAPSNFGPSLLITGTGTTLTQTGASKITVSNAGQILAHTGATLTSGTGLISVTGGSITTGSGGGGFNANGNISVTSGTITGLNAWASGRTMSLAGGSIYGRDMLSLAGNTMTIGGGYLNLRDVALNSASTATFQNGGRGMFRTLNIGSNNTGGALTVTGVNSRVDTNGAMTNTFGSASGPAATINVQSGGLMAMSTGSTVSLKPTATITINAGSVTTDALAIDGGKIDLQSGQLTVGPALSIASGGAIDVHANAMVVTSGDAGTWNGSTYTGITGLVVAGRNGGSWDGVGIRSSDADALTTLAVAKASEACYIADTDTATWNGYAVTGSDVLVLYTVGGDADLNGSIDVDDYGQIDFNALIGGVLPGWSNGDFNYDGVVDVDDFGIIDQAFANQGAMTISSVPEPSAACGVAILAASLLKRRKRHWKTPGNP